MHESVLDARRGDDVVLLVRLEAATTQMMHYRVSTSLLPQAYLQHT